MSGGELRSLSDLKQWPGETADAFEARRQAEASKRAGSQQTPYIKPHTIAGTMAALEARGTTLPSVAPDRIKRPKIHEADIAEYLPPLDSAAYHKRLGEVASARAKGDPLAGNLASVGRVVFYAMSARIRLTIRQIARRAGCCKDTARRCIDFLAGSGLFGVLNVLTRVDNLLLRAANLYLAPAYIVRTKVKLSRRIAERSAAFLVECGKLLNLAVRNTGLNTTPLQQPGST